MLHKKLKNIRTSHKMTQEDLAVKLGVTRQTISKWENGISVPDADLLIQIADIFDVSISELLGTDDRSEETKETESENTKKVSEEQSIADTLAILNEQLAIKNRHRKTMIRMIKIVLIVISICILVPVLYSLFWMYIAATM